MKGSELRIGNYLERSVGNNTWDEFKVRPIDIYRLNEGTSWLIEHRQIPLTEEWLLKFGFETDNIEWWNGLISIGIYKDGLFFCPTEEIHVRIGKKIQYVHQLQNLYFALTGEELIINN